MADIPAGTGLGSSGSFTTALLKALHTYKKNLVHPARAGRAGLPHRDRPARASRSASRTSTSRPSAASPASSSCPTARSRPGRCKIDSETLYNLEDNLLLFFTGYSRSASAASSRSRTTKSKQHDQAMIDNLHFVKELGYQSKEALEAATCALRRADERPLGAQEAAQRRR